MRQTATLIYGIKNMNSLTNEQSTLSAKGGVLCFLDVIEN